MQVKLKTLVNQLEESKAKDIVVLDVRTLTTITDYMVIASGTSSKQVQSIAELAREKMKKEGFKALSSTGEENGEWILVDFEDVILHIMQPSTRVYYNLEELWKHA